MKTGMEKNMQRHELKPGLGALRRGVLLAVLLALPAAASEAPPPKDFTGLRTQVTVFPDWFKTSFWNLNDDIDDALKAGKKGILIYASAETCSYCIAFLEQSFGNPDIARRVQQQFDVYGLEVIGDTKITDVDGNTYHVKDFTRKYKAYVTPTLLFFGKDGKLLLNITGYYTPDKFRRVLDYFEGNHHQATSWRAYQAQGEATPGAVVRDRNLFPLNPAAMRRAGGAAKPLLVLFESPACADCGELHGKTLKLPSTRALIRKYDAIQLDASDGATSIVTPRGRKTTPKQWATELELAYFPAFVFFDEQGAEVFRIDTLTRNERLNGALELVLTKGYRDEPQLQRWRNRKGAH
jgi:thioredoxin-related protein